MGQNSLCPTGSLSGHWFLVFLILGCELHEDRNRFMAGFPALDHAWNRMCTQKVFKELKNVLGRSTSFEIHT